MLRSRLMIGVALLALLGVLAGCAADLEQPPEAANTLERTVEEAIVVSEEPAEEVDVDLEQPTGETDTFTLKGWVTVDAYHYDEATGTYIHFYHDESSNLVVDIGLQWIEDQLGGNSPTAVSAQYIALSSDVGNPAAAWTIVPGEIVDAFGLARALGTYSTTATTGEWTISNTFSASGGSYTAVRLTGLHWAASGADNLLAANTFTGVDLNDGDSLSVTWTLSVAGP